MYSNNTNLNTYILPPFFEGKALGMRSLMASKSWCTWHNACILCNLSIRLSFLLFFLGIMKKGENLPSSPPPFR